MEHQRYEGRGLVHEVEQRAGLRAGEQDITGGLEKRLKRGAGTVLPHHPEIEGLAKERKWTTGLVVGAWRGGLVL